MIQTVAALERSTNKLGYNVMKAAKFSVSL
jgi:hypothetical protein